MTTVRMTVSCPLCKMTTRIHADLERKPTVIGGPQYCMYCGHKGVGVSNDIDLTTDEVLAESYDMSLTRFRKVYELWLLLVQTNDAPRQLSMFIEEVNRAALAKQAK